MNSLQKNKQKPKLSQSKQKPKAYLLTYFKYPNLFCLYTIAFESSDSLVAMFILISENRYHKYCLYSVQWFGICYQDSEHIVHFIPIAVDNSVIVLHISSSSPVTRGKSYLLVYLEINVIFPSFITFLIVS